MAWDSSRVVPWKRLVREWLLYVAIMATVLTIYSLSTDAETGLGLYAGLLASGPMYVGLGALLAKFGYQRKTFKDLRAAREADGGAPSAEATSNVRARPAPTRRTSTGPSNRPGGRPAGRPSGANRQNPKQKRR